MTLTVKELHERAGRLDLSHWNAVETFSLMEAALLSIGADPLDLDCRDEAYLRASNHPNWKYGVLFLRGLKEGVCTGELICIDIYVKIYHDQWGNWEPHKADLLELSTGQADDILDNMTKISRKTLYDWYKRKEMRRSQNPPIRQAVIHQEVAHISSRSTIEAQPLVIALPAPSYLDRNHPLSSLELIAATEAWKAVTENGDPRASGAAIKASIRKYLDEHEEYRKFSNEAKERICTTVNWNKKGGATRTP
jgi:hypothetical protein